MLGLEIGLGSGFDYFRQYNVIRRIGIRRNGAEPNSHSAKIQDGGGRHFEISLMAIIPPFLNGFAPNLIRL